MLRYRHVKISVLAGLAVLATAAVARGPAGAHQAVTDQLVRAAWMSFENGVSCPATEAANMIAAGAPGGAGGISGVRELYCSAARVLPAIVLQGLAGTKIFASGPHADGKLDLSSPQFGQYNLAFVRWAADHLIPGARDPEFRAATQPLYDRHLRGLVRAYAAANHYFDRRPGDLSRIAREYRAAIDAAIAPGSVAPLPPARRLSDAVNPVAACLSGGAGDVGFRPAAEAAAFWVRRSIDGSRPTFAAALSTLLETYDAEYAPSTCDGGLAAAPAGH